MLNKRLRLHYMTYLTHNVVVLGGGHLGPPTKLWWNMNIRVATPWPQKKGNRRCSTPNRQPLLLAFVRTLFGCGPTMDASRSIISQAVDSDVSTSPPSSPSSSTRPTCASTGSGAVYCRVSSRKTSGSQHRRRLGPQLQAQRPYAVFGQNPQRSGRILRVSGGWCGVLNETLASSKTFTCTPCGAAHNILLRTLPCHEDCAKGCDICCR